MKKAVVKIHEVRAGVFTEEKKLISISFLNEKMKKSTLNCFLIGIIDYFLYPIKNKNPRLYDSFLPKEGSFLQLF